MKEQTLKELFEAMEKGELISFLMANKKSITKDLLIQILNDIDIWLNCNESKEKCYKQLASFYKKTKH